MCGVVIPGVGDLPCEYVEAWEPGDLESANSGVGDLDCEAASSMPSAEFNSGLSEPGDLKRTNTGVEDFSMPSAEVNSGLSELSVFSHFLSFLLLSCVSI